MMNSWSCAPSTFFQQDHQPSFYSLEANQIAPMPYDGGRLKRKVVIIVLVCSPQVSLDVDPSISW